MKRIAFASAAAGVLGLGLVGLQAADHAEAPTAGADPAADIADLYAWHTDDSTLVTVLTFAGLGVSGDPAMYDEDVPYGIHIDNDGDAIADQDIWARFAPDSLGNWGLQVQGLPGTGAPVSGAVEQVIEAPGGRIFAGLRDDPFFFDLGGFNTTVSTGDLTFDSSADSLAGTNVTSIVLEMDLGSALDGAESLSIWSTTSRI
ncbi:MAG: DUF4331 domain-containing protein [Proteobacteria bacterium]|nr:DUF4331 domain-containing protein [Pseudomonadota bacterium]